MMTPPCASQPQTNNLESSEKTFQSLGFESVASTLMRTSFSPGSLYQYQRHPVLCLMSSRREEDSRNWDFALLVGDHSVLSTNHNFEHDLFDGFQICVLKNIEVLRHLQPHHGGLSIEIYVDIPASGHRSLPNVCSRLGQCWAWCLCPYRKTGALISCNDSMHREL